jgi:formylglycine-generating enzyme required for sulfatase activity
MSIIEGATVRFFIATVLCCGIINAARGAVQFDWVTVGNPGNAADAGYGFGAVSYVYRISRLETTNAQYVEFLNAVDPAGGNALGLYDSRMSSNSGGVAYRGGIDFVPAAPGGPKYVPKPGEANQPVVWVSWMDVARFVNWLSNGQGAGGPESGAYDMSAPVPQRSASATFVIPSEDEWYKAAYFDPTASPSVPGGTTYQRYPMRSNTGPHSDQPPGAAAIASDVANIFRIDGPTGGPYDPGYAVTGSSTLDPSINYKTAVGAYPGAASYFGTLDQAGNVREWNESTTDLPGFPVGARGLRGGSWTSGETITRKDIRGYDAMTDANHERGFRVAYVPEPAAGMAASVASVLFCAVRRRRRLHN